MLRPKTRKALLTIHKWLGLTGALWIAVLGATGLILDHRDDWGWAWRVPVPHSWLPTSTVKSIENRDITQGQANPADPSEWLVGGATGLWHTRNGGEDWAEVSYSDAGFEPMLNMMIVDGEEGWQRVWLATEDGLWFVDGTEAKPQARRAGMAGMHLTALDLGANEGSLVVVDNRTDILLWSKSSDTFTRISLDRVAVEGLPDEISWSRFIFDLHLGRGLINRPQSMLINDFGAIAFLILPLGGVLYWLMPKIWKRRKKTSAITKRRTMTVLYRLHAPVIGVLSLIPLLYLSVTGIVMDHREELISSLIKNTVPRSALPPVYGFSSLEDEIGALAAYPGVEGAFSIGTRLGVMTSTDYGKSWKFESSSGGTPGFNVLLKRAGDKLLAGGMGGAPLARPLAGGDWQPVKGVRGMAHDVSESDGSYYMLGMPTMFSGSIETGVESFNFPIPRSDHSPLMLVLYPLHNGKLIHPEFRYLLDVFALITILMVITGPILWWRRRW